MTKDSPAPLLTLNGRSVKPPVQQSRVTNHQIWRVSHEPTINHSHVTRPTTICQLPSTREGPHYGLCGVLFRARKCHSEQPRMLATWQPFAISACPNAQFTGAMTIYKGTKQHFTRWNDFEPQVGVGQRQWLSMSGHGMTWPSVACVPRTAARACSSALKSRT